MGGLIFLLGIMEGLLPVLMISLPTSSITSRMRHFRLRSCMPRHQWHLLWVVAGFPAVPDSDVSMSFLQSAAPGRPHDHAHYPLGPPPQPPQHAPMAAPPLTGFPPLTHGRFAMPLPPTPGGFPALPSHLHWGFPTHIPLVPGGFPSAPPPPPPGVLPRVLPIPLPSPTPPTIIRAELIKLDPMKDAKPFWTL